MGHMHGQVARWLGCLCVHAPWGWPAALGCPAGLVALGVSWCTQGAAWGAPKGAGSVPVSVPVGASG